jgi:hypothetical protein
MIECIGNVNTNQIYHAFNQLIYYKQIIIYLFLFQKLILQCLYKFDCSSEIDFQFHTFLLIETLFFIFHNSHQHFHKLFLLKDVETLGYPFEF